MGPAFFIDVKPSIPLIQVSRSFSPLVFLYVFFFNFKGMMAIRGIGESFTLSDAFKRIIYASSQYGFSQDLKTYLQVSGKVTKYAKKSFIYKTNQLQLCGQVHCFLVTLLVLSPQDIWCNFWDLEQLAQCF